MQRKSLEVIALPDIRDSSLDPDRVLQVRRGSASDWTTINPVLQAGEFGYETDTQRVKVGDGTTPWTGLAYQGATQVVATAPTSLPPGQMAIVVTNGVATDLYVGV